MVSKKKLLTHGAMVIACAGIVGFGVNSVNNNNGLISSVLAETQSDSGYSNVLNFSAKSKVLESTSSSKQHEPMDLIQVIDLSGSLSDGEFRSRNGSSGARKQQINDMIYVIENKLTDADHVMLAFYGTNTSSSYAFEGQEGAVSTRLLSKAEALAILKQLNNEPQVHSMSQSWELIPNVVRPLLGDKVSNSKKNDNFEDVYLAQPNRNKVVSVLQFTDDWTANETIDTSFAEWSKKNAKTFMTVVDSAAGESSTSFLEMKKSGHPNIKVFTRIKTPNRQKDIADLFESTAIVTTKTTTTTKQKGNVTITPDADLTLKSAELVAPNGSKTALKIDNNKVVWTGDLEDGNYKVNYTFDGKPSVERSIRSVVTVDGNKVDEKVNTVKPEKILFETKYENDSSLADGQEKEKQAGVEGLKYSIIRDGKVVSTVIGKEKQDRIVLRGTKGSDTDVSKKAVPFETKYIEDPALEFGKTRVAIEGSEGEIEVIKVYVTQSGKRVGEPTVSEKIVKPKVNKVIAVGTKPAVTTKELDFKTIYVEDKELEAKKQEVRTEGQKGTETTTQTYTFNAETGEATPNEAKVDVTAAVDKVVAVGTKPVVTTKELDFKTTYVEDKEMDFGKKETRTEGKKGTETTTQTYSFNAETGEVTDNEPKVEKLDAVNEVIAVGTKPVVTTKDLDFKTTYVEDKEMDFGKKETRTEGKKGLETSTQTYNFNAESGEVKANEVKVEKTDAVDEVIAVGTKPVVTTKDLDFKTTYVEDKEMDFGKKETRTEGKKGTEKTTQTYTFNAETGEVKADEPKVENTDTVDEVIVVGTKPTVTTKDLDFKVERRKNENMKKGTEKVVRKGQKGLETTTQTYKFDAKTGEVTPNEPKVEVKKAVDEIIEYGVNEGKQLPQTNNNGLIGVSIAGLVMVVSAISAFVYKRFKNK